MSLQLKNTRLSGETPNLLPGETAVNIVDEVYWVRARGKKIAISFTTANARAIPRGAPDAPMMRHGSTIGYRDDLTPASTHFGVVAVDAPPVGGLSIPGFYATGPGVSATQLFGINTTILERFQVVSDGFVLTKLAFNAVTTPTGSVRLGLTDAAGHILADYLITTPVAGLNTKILTANIPKGQYFVVLWTQAAITLRQVFGVRPEQGWDYDGAGQPAFKRRIFSTASNQSGGLVDVAVASSTLNAQPGENRAILFDWTLPQ